MAIEKHICLREAERKSGVGRKALKRWLAKEMGYVFPVVRRGSKIMVRERDVELVLERHRDARAVLSKVGL
jgi:predicted site-specific integrase-resolvase